MLGEICSKPFNQQIVRRASHKQIVIWQIRFIKGWRDARTSKAVRAKVIPQTFLSSLSKALTVRHTQERHLQIAGQAFCEQIVIGQIKVATEVAYSPMSNLYCMYCAERQPAHSLYLTLADNFSAVSIRHAVGQSQDMM